MATTMLPPGFGGIVGVPATSGPKVVRALGQSFDIRDGNATNFLISGTTKDSTGTVLGNCDVHLFTTLDDLEVQQSVSDANGAYAFYVHSNVAHYIVAYKAGSPDVAGTTVNTINLPSLIDSYSESNQATLFALSSEDNTGVGQSFTAATGLLGTCRFFLNKFGSPTGNATANLYAITGTPGNGALPTGAALATSDVFNVATLTTSFALVTFTFSGANQYSLVNATNYFITCEYAGGNATNAVQVGVNNLAPTHAGNAAVLLGTWSPFNTYDTCFYVYKA